MRMMNRISDIISDANVKCSGLGIGWIKMMMLMVMMDDLYGMIDDVDDLIIDDF